MKKYAFCLLLTSLYLDVSAQKQVEKIEEYLLVFPIDTVTVVDDSLKDVFDLKVKSVVLTESYAIFSFAKPEKNDVRLETTVYKILSIDENSDPPFYIYNFHNLTQLSLALTDEKATLSYFVLGKPGLEMISTGYKKYQ